MPGIQNFPYFVQDTEQYCGPACIQMMIKFIDVNSQIKQDDIVVGEDVPASLPALFEVDPGWKKNFNKSPVEMINMLRHAGGSALDTSLFNLRRFSKKSEITNKANFKKELVKLCTGCSKEKPPPIIPIHVGSHWVILHRCEGSIVDGKDKRVLIGKDPYLDPENMPKGATSVAGTISITMSDYNFTNPENYVLIEKRDGSINTTSIAIIKESSPSHPSTNIESARLNSLPVMDPSAFPQIVSSELISYGIDNPANSNSHLFRTVPGKPMLVKQLDSRGRDYYLISFQNVNGDSALLARLDAVTGELLDTLHVPLTKYLLAGRESRPTSPQADSLARVSLSPLPLQGLRLTPQHTQAFNNEMARVAAAGKNVPQLVWKPCVQSESAFFPFYKVPFGNDFFYVRIDGKYSQKLTTFAEQNQT